MHTRIDLPKLESYSIAFSEKLCNEFYQGNTAVISGPEILKFSAIEQLNLFIVKNLFEKWKEETSKLRSPYFDYEDENVKEALTAFLNKLSKHISIRKEFFKPLVKKSVSDSLAYLIDPYQFLKVEFLGKPIITLSELMEKEKYIRVNKFFIQSLIKKMQLQNKTGFPEPEVLSYFEEVYKNFESSIDPPEKHIEAFAKVLPITLNDILEKGPERPRDPVLNYREILNANVKKDEIPFKGPLADTIHERSSVATINDSFARSKQVSLNDVMRKGEDVSILSKHRKSKIHDLKTSVPINLRYIFINELFKGNLDDYNLAIVQIERCGDYSDAENILDQVYSKKYEWAEDKTVVKEFLEIIERRFY